MCAIRYRPRRGKPHNVADTRSAVEPKTIGNMMSGSSLDSMIAKNASAGDGARYNAACASSLRPSIVACLTSSASMRSRSRALLRL